MTDRQRQRSEQVWLVVLLVMSSACVAQAFGRFTWGLVLPGARDEFLDGSNTLAGFFGTINVTFYLVGTFVMSWAASKMTLVGLIRTGLVISTTAIGIASIAPSGPVLGIALAMMGFGGAVIWIPSPAIAARSLGPRRAGMAAGLIGSGIGIGITLAGQLTAALGRASGDSSTWQMAYRIEFAIALVVLIGTFVLLRSHGDRPGATGGFGGVSALRTIQSWIPMTIAYASFGFAYILVLGYLVTRLEDDAGFSTSSAKLMFSLVGFSAVVGGLALGPLSDRVGRRRTLMTTFILFGLCGLLVLTGRQPWVAVASVGIGVMFSGMPSLIIAHVVVNTDQDSYGPAFSAATLAFGVTQMVSPLIGGAIADATGSFTWVFILSAGVSFVGAAAASQIRDRPAEFSTSQASTGR